jgi:uncharacterized protein
MSVKLFYASDVHGSERLWRKFVNAGAFYGVDVLVMGGDLAGKAVLPIERTNGGFVASRITGDRLLDESELDEVKTRIRNLGFYPYQVDHDELAALKADKTKVDEVFLRVMKESLERWMTLAEERLAGTGIRLYMMLGNDDEPALRDVLAASSLGVDAEDRLIDLGEGYQMVSCGYSNPTPWHSPRELPEDELARRLDAQAKRLDDPSHGVFNFHVPPFGTQLDQAPALDETLKPKVKGGTLLQESVGSTAVRAVIERYQPVLGLHGHIHESRGTARLGKTLCVNPGSAYTNGVLDGVLIELDNKGRVHYQLTSG